MSKLTDSSITIFTALKNIEDGKYAMPAFQRQFVWSMEQIEKLWDSILLDYPIATFLFWELDNNNITWDTYFCSFLKEINFNSRKLSDSINYELSGINVKITDTAILDGQQRLTSLYLSLFGSAFLRPKGTRKQTNAKIATKLLIELNRHKSLVDEEEYNSKKYDIRFTDKIGKQSPTQFEIKNILNEEFQNELSRERAIEEAIIHVPPDSKAYARNILNKLYGKIFVEKLIRYTSISDMKQDDALEMFVRFNSGGKVLKKSEITMSILGAYWANAKLEFGKVLVDAYRDFGEDFIIRTALMLYGDVVKSNINKQVADDLKANWNNFKQALLLLEDLLSDWQMELKRFSNGWNVLLPVIYCIYYNPNYSSNTNAIKAYLLRAIFFTYFQSGTTSKLQQMKNNINEYNFEITIELLEQMSELRVTDAKVDDLLNSEKGSRVAGEILYYLSTDWISHNCKYEQDHLHPESKFYNRPFSVGAEDWKRWHQNRNKLPNLYLLEGRSNGSKFDMRLIDYYGEMNDEQKASFYKKALIPENISFELENFEEFYRLRKELLAGAIYRLLG